MTITESLYKALTLLGLGMTFVFLFLGLLLIAVKLMAKYIPADELVSNKKAKPQKVAPAASATSEINPKLIAAITTAVQKHRNAVSA